MAEEHLFGSKVMTSVANTTPALKARSGLSGGKVRAYVDTVEVSAAASVASTYTLARIPSNAIILDQSELSWDDLANSGSPDLDIGLYAASGQNMTDDVDCLNDGLDGATATRGARVIKGIESSGKMAWEYVSGLTADPGGWFDVKVVITVAACDLGGTLSLNLLAAIE